MIVILHSIRSVFNVGSIFRTADGVGIDKIYLCGVTPTPLDKFRLERADFIKVSLGAEKSVSWEHKYSTVKLLDKLKREGFEILAVEQDLKSVPYYEYYCHSERSEESKLKRLLRRSAPRNNDGGLDKLSIVMGAEVNGLPKSILDRADKILEIPMKGKKESLNVSVAFGIVAYHLTYGYVEAT